MSEYRHTIQGSHLAPTLSRMNHHPRLGDDYRANLRRHVQGNRGHFRGAGFTLMEMMVAMVIASIMTGLIFVIFNTVTLGVSRGIQISAVIQNSRMIGDKIQRDFLGMTPPGDPAADPTGVLIIVQHAALAPMPDANDNQTILYNYNDVTDATASPVIRQTDGRIRRDQIAFIGQSASGTEANYALLPTTAGDASNYYHDARGNYARIWYGHVERPTSGGSGTAMHWTLGRQSLLLTAWNTDLGAVPAWYVTAPFFDSLMANVAAGYSGTSRLNDGFTDVFFATVAADGVGVDHPTINGLNFLMDSTVGLPGQHSGNYNNYREHAHRLAFGVNDAVNSYPLKTDTRFSNLDPNIPNPTHPWNVNRTHAAFMESVSDFAIEFAADIANDVPGIPDLTKPWEEDGEPDRVTANITIGSITIPAGAIKWYGHYYNDPVADARRDFDGIEYTGFDTSRPVVFQIPGSYTPYDDGDPNPPQVIETASGNAIDMTAASATFVWMNDNTNTPPFVDWPYLIRIRYRLHDKVGRYKASYPTATGDSIAVNGRWFEQIIPVNRN